MRAQEPEVFICETGWPDSRMYFVVMRKNMRFDGREPDVL